MSNKLNSLELGSQYKQEFFSLGVTKFDQIKANNERLNSLMDARRVSEGKFDTPELAAQEHYAYTRAEVSESGEFAKQVISVVAYEALKSFPNPVVRVFIREVLGTGPRSSSPSSFENLLKGLEGAIDGLKDYQNSKKDSDSPWHLSDPKQFDLNKPAELQKEFNQWMRDIDKLRKDGSSELKGDKLGRNGRESGASGLGSLADGKQLGHSQV